jgi:hypothetical protein
MAFTVYVAAWSEIGNIVSAAMLCSPEVAMQAANDGAARVAESIPFSI